MTRFADWNPWAARLVLAAVAVLVMLAAVPRQQHVDYFGRPPEWRDWMLDRNIANRIMQGEDYYAAAAAEHRLHLYPTTPPQVFREPTLDWMLAALRSDTARRLAIFALSLATLFALYDALARTRLDRRLRYLALVPIAGAIFMAWTPPSAYVHEIWAGLLIALSLACYRPGVWWLAVLFGVAACLIRELSLPYLGAMAAFALAERRWRELTGWIAAIAVFAVLFVLHLAVAGRLYLPGDLTFTSAGWIHFGGWPFVVDTAKFNLFLLRAPNVVIALWALLGVVGLAAARDPWFSRAALVVGGYMIAFLFVGLPANTYWGLLTAPLLPIGLVLAPAALRDLAVRSLPQLPRSPVAAREGE